MKKLFSIALVAIFAFAMNAKAQNQLIATLNHEGTVTVFYGADAFANAHGAATHGDVITLSPGKFKSTNITKAITIQGAGITTKIDSVSQIEPTILQGDFDIEIADSITQQLKVEGIYHHGYIIIKHLRNPQFIKCRFYGINNSGYQPEYSGYVMENLNFINCRIANTIALVNSNATATFANCIISNVSQSSGSSCTFVNCYTRAQDCSNSEYRNCVLYGSNSHYNSGIVKDQGNATSNYYNNLLVCSNNQAYLDQRYDTNNRTVSTDAIVAMFKEYSDANTYELTEELKALMKGTDGTEVGIYGGLFPYDPVPNIPQITKFKVANKSTADGKLKVEVEVKGAE